MGGWFQQSNTLIHHAYTHSTHTHSHTHREGERLPQLLPSCILICPSVLGHRSLAPALKPRPRRPRTSLGRLPDTTRLEGIDVRPFASTIFWQSLISFSTVLPFPLTLNGGDLAKHLRSEDAHVSCSIHRFPLCQLKASVAAVQLLRFAVKAKLII